MLDLKAHHDALLLRGRCGRCAEPVKRYHLLRGLDCTHCGASLATWGTGDLPERLERGRWRWRLVGYGLVGAASFVVGAVPLLQSGLQILALLVLHVTLLRRPLLWLTPARRLTARTTIKLVGAFLGSVSVLVNVAVAPLPIVSSAVLAGVGFAFTAAYVECGLMVIRQRLRWEADHRPMSVVEWGVPALLVGAILLSTLAVVGTVAGSLHLLAAADIPTVSELAARLLEV
ncbi:MAG: hypothetical protein CL927_11740 [Deltaproteobacteria bacterium]|nr:hypothetical protein [Deltaproteobacteria bacterium]HCH64614.1 hypothetical protein [Deltaproteobacteria bacterium]